MKDLKIFDRLEHDYKYVTDRGYNVLGVFLQGSQNYGLDYEGSDIDTKAIIIPSFEDFVLNRKPVSTTLILPSNEHIDLKDIRLMHDCFRKQNINFLEILFTKYIKFNPEYEDLYSPMIENRVERLWYTDRFGVPHYETVGVCRGTKGMEDCSCDGNELNCTFYPEVREKASKRITINDAINHFNYGISHDIFSEPVTTYARMAVEALEKMREG